MHLVHGGLSVNGDVTFTHDHVLDQGDQVIIHLVYEGLSVNGDVRVAVDLVLDQEVHVLMHLGEGGIRVHSVVIGTTIPIRAFTIDCRSFFHYVYRNLNFQQK